MMHRLFLLLGLCLIALPALAADEFYIGAARGADVYNSPQTNAGKVGHLDRLSPVKVIQKQRGWYKIRQLEAKEPVIGWVHAGAVRKRYTRSAGQKAKSSFFSSLSSFFHASEPNQQTAVLGVRGLEDEGNAAAGKANRAGVQWMEQLKVSDADIAAFIEEGRLNP